MQLIGRLLSDICNVVPHLLPGVKLQIKLTKCKRPFYLMSTKADSTTKFQFIEEYLIVNRIRPYPSYLTVHNTSLAKGYLARYRRRSNSRLSLFHPFQNSCPMPMPFSDSCRNVYFSVIENKDFTVDTNTIYFSHFNINHFTLYYNGRPIPEVCL